jgi:hypothetical protein
MNPADVFFNALGILGALLLLFGFYRVGIGRWTNSSLWYEFDNALGATLLVIYQIKYHAYVTVVVNAIWGAVALWGLVTFAYRAKTHHRRSRSIATSKGGAHRKA